MRDHLGSQQLVGVSRRKNLAVLHERRVGGRAGELFKVMSD